MDDARERAADETVQLPDLSAALAELAAEFAATAPESSGPRHAKDSDTDTNSETDSDSDSDEPAVDPIVTAEPAAPESVSPPSPSLSPSRELVSPAPEVVPPERVPVEFVAAESATVVYGAGLVVHPGSAEDASDGAGTVLSRLLGGADDEDRSGDGDGFSGADGDAGEDDARGAYRGRRRQGVGAVGWLRGLGTVPLLFSGGVIVALLATLTWWAGSGPTGTPVPPVALTAPTTAGVPVAAPAAPTSAVPSATSTPGPSHGHSAAPHPSTVKSASPAPQSVVRYEAEVASFGPAPDTRAATDHPGYSGTGFVDFANAKDSFVQWQVATQKAGPVRLVFRYANAAADNRPLDLFVNGLRVTQNWTFPSTGDWATWGARTATVTLPAGTSTVKVIATTAAGGPNVDYLEVQA